MLTLAVNFKKKPPLSFISVALHGAIARRFIVLGMLLVVAALQGCSQGSQPINNANTPIVENPEGITVVYKGPNPTTPDVERFMDNVWRNLAREDRCGRCHIEGGQSPQFVRGDDIDQAYLAAQWVVDLQTPAQSRMVAKVGGGHNCWLAEPNACADTLQTWITAWANAKAEAAGEQANKNVVELLAPVVKPVSSTKPFPPQSDAFAITIHQPFLRRYCSDCHSPDGVTPQQPYFAGSDAAAAYIAAQSKINLGTPERSRMLERLREESHNCWSADCNADANALEQAIRDFASGITAAEVNPSWVVSNALNLTDGVLANTGGRVESDLVAKYEFKTGRGRIAYDTSGQEPALNLNLSGNVDWLDGGIWGLKFLGGRAQGATAASKKLYRKISFTGEYSIEAWVTPANVVQEGPARLVSYSGGNNSRNFTLGQSMYNYDFLSRSPATDLNGSPRLSTPNADEVLQATLQHVVATFHYEYGRRIYVNGELIEEEASTNPDINALFSPDMQLSGWDDTFALILGLETSGMYPWLGTMRFLGVHNRALSAQSVAANFQAGVGEKFFLLFRVTDSLNPGAIPEGTQAYVVFEVESFDSYSYLFANPLFYILDPNKTPNSAPPVPLQAIDLQGLRIGVNGREALIGQAYANLNTTIDAQNYVPGKGASLSRLGALIPLEQGKAADEFFLTFERLQAKTFSRPLTLAPPLAEPEAIPDALVPPNSGIKIFAEINASLAQMTGVDATRAAVNDTYQKVRQQLPVDENMEGFLPAHHMGVTQLAVAYCDALMQDNALRASKFLAFDFTATPAQAFSPQGRDALITPLLDALVITVDTLRSTEVARSNSAEVIDSNAGITDLSSGPSSEVMHAELNNLIDIMTRCGASCSADTTTNTATAVCAAALGSAAMLVQ